MSRADFKSTQQPRGTKGRFISWEIAEPHGDDPHTLADLVPTTATFFMQLAEPVRNGHHGIALYDCDNQLIWANSFEGFHLPAGVHGFSHSFPMIPIRPGPYTWLVSLYNDGDLVDLWNCVPELIVATDSYQHQDDRWNGILNMPSKFHVGEKVCRE